MAELYLPDYSRQLNQLGQTIGGIRRQNALASVAPQALAGDGPALNRLAMLDPSMAATIQQNQYTRQRQETADKSASEAARREIVRGVLTDGAGMIVNMPEAELPNAWTGIRAQMIAQAPELATRLPEQYDPSVLATAKGLAGMKPAAPAGPTDDMREFEYSRQNPEFAEFLRSMKHSGSSGTPYFNFLPGADGYLVGNARTGEIAPGMVNGQRAVPGSLDPTLQGALVSAKEGAKADVERDTAVKDRARSANDTLSLLDEAEKLIPNATGSLLGVGRDAALATVGKSTPGADATAQLQAIAGQLTSKMPRMEGPQSNFDVQLYRDMAGDLANPRLPNERRMAAARTIRLLNEKYADQQSQTAAPEQQPTRKRFNPQTGRIE